MWVDWKLWGEENNSDLLCPAKGLLAFFMFAKYFIHFMSIGWVKTLNLLAIVVWCQLCGPNNSKHSCNSLYRSFSQCFTKWNSTSGNNEERVPNFCFTEKQHGVFSEGLTEIQKFCLLLGLNPIFICHLKTREHKYWSLIQKI